ncbi:MAG: hypothetical protein EHM42_03450, partial [Planctomycetaceae bacterium]
MWLNSARAPGVCASDRIVRQVARGAAARGCLSARHWFPYRPAVAAGMPSPGSSATRQRPLRLRRRRDLQSRPETLRGQTVWAVKDPLAKRYFHLSLESWWLLLQLDGAATLESLQQRFDQRFFPQSLSIAELESHLASFHQQGLIVSDSTGQTGELLARARRNTRREFRNRFLNPLAIRFRGVDPSRWLESLQPATRWLWRPTVLALGLAWILSAIALLLANLDEIMRRIPENSEYLSGQNVVLLAAAL